jgi:quercetin dioxygenase-like cupin family protein
MNAARMCAGVGVVLLAGGLLGRNIVSAGGPGSAEKAKERARVVFAQALPALDGAHLKATLVEVKYGRGEASAPHSHPCAVIGYVEEGSIRSQVQGQAVMTYQAGESFYEAPNGVHVVSANASATEPAKLLAYLICDHEGPLSTEVGAHPQEGNR